ncbi:MAG TPA: hypothetical protein VK820_12070 [Steroidobacteraceae bacterium]|jgi:hypothetical protein|nr:hypothetical protein [Steroidobacteraceae bacterium]
MQAHGENIALSDGGNQPLPYQKPLRTWASRGTGATCDLCNGRIHPPDIEYQIEVAPNGEARMLHMHFGCHQRWALEGRHRTR